MVCINTGKINYRHHNLRFTHFVEVPTSECIICTAREEDTRKAKIYLVFNRRDRVYQRNGINGTWDELPGFQQRRVRQLITNAFNDRNIPHFSTRNISILN